MSFAEMCPEGEVAILPDVHPNEWTSEDEYDLYRLLDQKQPDGVWATRANELTWSNNRKYGRNDRYTAQNLQRIDPEYAAANPDAYEVIRKPQLLAATHRARIVLEPHSNQEEVSYAWCERDALPVVRGIVSALGIDKVIGMSPHMLGAGRRNYVMLDYDVTRKAEYLSSMYDVACKLASGSDPEPGLICEYEFVADVAVGDAQLLGLPEEHPAFQPFDQDVEEKLAELGIQPGCVPLTWSYQKYGAVTGCLGELIRPLGII